MSVPKKRVIIASAVFVLLLILTALLLRYPVKKESIVLLPANRDIQNSYEAARKRATKWNGDAVLENLSVAVMKDGKELLYAYFYGPEALSRYADRAEVIVEIKSGQIANFQVLKGSDEPNYGTAPTPLTGEYRRNWREIIDYVDQDIAADFQRQYGAVEKVVSFQNGIWGVQYIAQDRLFRVNIDDDFISDEPLVQDLPKEDEGEE